MSQLKSAGTLTSALIASTLFTAPMYAGGVPVFSGPVPYTNITNSLFFANLKAGQDYYIEDFERGVITAPGFFVNDPSAFIAAPGATTDSVDIDDATLNGSGTGGRSLANSTIGILNLQFNSGVLGGFPTKVGLVWTDGLPNSSVTLTVIGGSGSIGFQTFTGLGDGNGNGGTAEDRFIGVEFDEGIAQIQVAGSGATVEIDHVQYSAPVAGDLYIRDKVDGDTKSDLAWHDPTNGNVDIWLMNGLVRGGGLANQTASANWVAQGIGDLDDDGDADIVWRDSATNLFHVWIMNGQTVVESAQMVGPSSLASTWVCVGVGDTNGDRKADVIFRNTSTNLLNIWYMNGKVRTSGGSVTDTNSAAMSSSGYEFLAAGDFNGDGRYDLLWRNTTTNKVHGWLLNGRTVFFAADVGNSNGVGTQWIPGSAGDFNGDGRTDMSWRNTTTGNANVWLLEGLYRRTGGLSSPIGLQWTLRASADINGDGKDDLIWQNGTNNFVNGWIMDGIVKASGGNITTLTSPTYSIINR